MKFFYDLLILKTSTFQETSVVMHEKHSDKVCVENMFLSKYLKAPCICFECYRIIEGLRSTEYLKWCVFFCNFQEFMLDINASNSKFYHA